MDFSKSDVVELTLEGSKTASAEEKLEEVKNSIISAAKCGLWQIQVVLDSSEETQGMLWVSAKLQRMGFQVIMVLPGKFDISWKF